MSTPASRPTSGISYLPDANGQILPVIDLTHPAFAITLSEAQLQAKADAHARDERRRERLPRWLLRALLYFPLRNSDLARRLRGGHGRFLDGMSTYRLKLGPDQLDPSWAAPIDKLIAASAPCLFLRLRLQDMAELLAHHLAPRLAASPSAPLHLFNIAGGPSMDSLNALAFLRRRDPALLRPRRVEIHLLDQDDVGPDFAARALAAWRQPERPLAGIDVSLTHLHYLWSDPARLRARLALLPPDAIAAASSEGGLFNYGTDADVLANLEVLRDALPVGSAIAGTLSPPNLPGANSVFRPRFAVVERTLPAFTSLVQRAGWRVAEARQRPFHTSLLLV